MPYHKKLVTDVLFSQMGSTFPRNKMLVHFRLLHGHNVCFVLIPLRAQSINDVRDVRPEIYMQCIEIL